MSLLWLGVEPETSPSRSECATTYPNLLGWLLNSNKVNNQNEYFKAAIHILSKINHKELCMYNINCKVIDVQRLMTFWIMYCFEYQQFFNQSI